MSKKSYLKNVAATKDQDSIVNILYLAATDAEIFFDDFFTNGDFSEDRAEQVKNALAVALLQFRKYRKNT